MTDTQENQTIPTRRVRPWLAVLLTFLGWGVGLYYARKTRAAIYVVVGQVILTVLVATALLIYLASSGPTQFPFVNPNGFSATEIVGWILTIIVAVGVCRFVGKQDKTVERAGPERLWGYFGIWLLPVIAGVLLALPIRMFALHPFHIPAGSMKPTLQVGEFFAVQKWSYGYSRASLVYPMTRIGTKGRMFGSTPQHGDVVVFKNRKDGNKDYVKRVIGLPGDKIQMIEGHLFINEQPVTKELVEIATGVCGNGVDAPTYRETLDNGVSYMVQECSGDQGPLDNTVVYTVPPEHYFMLGDNRDQSQDSRIISAVGFIHYDDLVGKAQLAGTSSP